MSDLRIITEPSVFVLARPAIDEAELKRYLESIGCPDWTTDATTDAEKLIEAAGRVCYQSFVSPRPGGNAAYLARILEQGHGSVLEHANFTLLFTGVGRSLTQQLVRHRAGWGFSELSQRFVDNSDCEFVCHPAIAACRVDDPELYRRWARTVEFCRSEYEWIAERLERRYAHIPDRTTRRKRAREAARSVLPIGTASQIVVTANVRAWRHFCELRGDPSADAEIRRLAVAVLGVLQRECPNLFGEYRVEGEDPDREIVGTYRKV